MLNRITTRLDQVPEQRARNLNMVFSTVGGLIYVYLLGHLGAFHPYTVTALVLTAAVFDTSTVYFVHSGVLSRTLDRIFTGEQIDWFMRLHLWPAMIGYTALAAFLVSLYVEPVHLLYYVFFAGWLVTYTSGLYAFLRLR